MVKAVAVVKSYLLLNHEQLVAEHAPNVLNDPLLQHDERVEPLSR